MRRCSDELHGRALRHRLRGRCLPGNQRKLWFGSMLRSLRRNSRSNDERVSERVWLHGVLRRIRAHRVWCEPAASRRVAACRRDAGCARRCVCRPAAAIASRSLLYVHRVRPPECRLRCKTRVASVMRQPAAPASTRLSYLRAPRSHDRPAAKSGVCARAGAPWPAHERQLVSK